MSYNNNLRTNNNILSSILDSINNLPRVDGDGNNAALPELTNEGAASDLLSGKQLINQEGEVVTGTIATKTSNDLTASGATVSVPAGYYAANTNRTVQSAEQAAPSVTIDPAGLITASTVQSEGYVNAGTKTTMKQLTTQGAMTVIPGETEQVAVPAGVYTTGAIVVGAVPSGESTEIDYSQIAFDVSEIVVPT